MFKSSHLKQAYTNKSPSSPITSRSHQASTAVTGVTRYSPQVYTCPTKKKIPTNQKHYQGLGRDTSLVWNFCSRYSDVILQGLKWQPRKTSAVFPGHLFHYETHYRLFKCHPYQGQILKQSIHCPVLTYFCHCSNFMATALPFFHHFASCMSLFQSCVTCWHLPQNGLPCPPQYERTCRITNYSHLHKYERCSSPHPLRWI